ncbi:MAG: response regulator transcription factor [Flavobacteriales bacterium]|jgi:DNA-binding NarL/FixJ family response regulator|nr:response regulator transcription factor [Flavobacteriales bacterium]
MNDEVRILLVDDHQVLLDGIAALLAGVPGMRVIATAHNGVQALEALRREPAHVVLLDINMPEMDGLEACAAIKAGFPGTAVIAMSMHGEGRLVETMLGQGASGYLIKNCGGDELVEAIRTVHGGGTWLSREVTGNLVEAMRAPKAAAKQPMEEITPRERDVLRLIVAERTTAEIAAELGITVNTVESHRRQLLQKLGARNSAGLVRIALEMGLLGAPDKQ